MTEVEGAGARDASPLPNGHGSVGSNLNSKANTAAQAAVKRWRDVLKVHPAAEMFPRMSEDELRALADDIKTNGLKQPIVLWAPGYFGDGCKRKWCVLDGINRLDALEQAGIRFLDDRGCPTESFGARFIKERKEREVYGFGIGRRSGRAYRRVEPSTDPYAYVISANIKRRHLTAEQKRELIAELIKATPEKSDRQIAETIKASPTTVGAVRSKMEAEGTVSKLDTRTDSDGRQQPARKGWTAERWNKHRAKKRGKPTTTETEQPVEARRVEGQKTYSSPQEAHGRAEPIEPEKVEPAGQGADHYVLRLLDETWELSSKAARLQFVAQHDEELCDFIRELAREA